jgi:hypothetical protein
MTRVAILIPSHIRYNGQISLLDNCITSLLGQTLKPKSIYISISFENNTYKTDFERILQKYGSINETYIHFEISKEKKHQMEHLHTISSYVNDYDILMFCDDDDTYHTERVARFVRAFSAGKGFENFGGVREYTELINDYQSGSKTPEYWCYGIVPSLIRDFFYFFKGKHYTLLQHKFGDMYFKQYLCKNSKYNAWVGIIDAKFGFPLYNYNINNPHSICGKIELGKKLGIINFYDNLLLKTILCKSDSDFDNIINAYKDIYNINKNTIDSMKTTYDVCKLLYK